jgi:hypothetical protein
LVLAEGPGLLEQRVDECRLAVVDVRNDGDVPDLVLIHVVDVASKRMKWVP